ncbi:hypothetical protein AAFF_G00304160, partial [Aldrovandia affinis]
KREEERERAGERERERKGERGGEARTAQFPHCSRDRQRERSADLRQGGNDVGSPTPWLTDRYALAEAHWETGNHSDRGREGRACRKAQIGKRKTSVSPIALPGKLRVALHPHPRRLRGELSFNKVFKRKRSEMGLSLSSRCYRARGKTTAWIQHLACAHTHTHTHTHTLTCETAAWIQHQHLFLTRKV